MKLSPPIHVRAFGPIACFTRPESRLDRLSYEAPSHSAARGLIECVYWKPECFYIIHSVDILSPIVWESRYCNEVSDFNSLNQIDVEELRTQRMTTTLRHVDYVISFSIGISSKGEQDGEPLVKHVNIVTSRLSRGGHHEHPSFGLREFPAFLDLLSKRSDAPDPIALDRDIGPMYYDRLNYHDPFFRGSETSLFFRARIKGGVLSFPVHDEIAKSGLRIGRVAA